MSKNDGSSEARKPRAKYNHSKCTALALLAIARYDYNPPLMLSIRDVAEITGLNHHSLETSFRTWLGWRLIASHDHPIRGVKVYTIRPKGNTLLNIHQRGFMKINSLGKPVFYQVEVNNLIRELKPSLESWLSRRPLTRPLLSRLKP